MSAASSRPARLPCGRALRTLVLLAITTGARRGELTPPEVGRTSDLKKGARCCTRRRTMSRARSRLPAPRSKLCGN